MPSPLERHLRARIAADGPLSFADFMRAALYHPEHGYYARGPSIGAAGDFYTASNLPPFARALARQARDAWDLLGRPDPFRIVELGGGSGELAARLAQEIARDGDLAKAARIVLVEPSPGLAAAQRAHGFTVAGALSELASGPTLLLANEVLDALPVRLFAPGAERRVATQGERFAFRDFPAPAEPAVPEGCLVEVAEGLDALLADVARILGPGLALFLDYGDDPVPPRPGGTVRAFRAHGVSGDVLADPGTQDLTADVDFGAVRRAARAAGLREAGYTTQGRFLAALGAVDDLAHADLSEVLQAKTLLLPGGMGERFKVLGVARGADGEPRGFRPPW